MAEGEITSANVVGYTAKNDIKVASWQMIAAQFEGIGKTAVLDINEAFGMSGVKPVGYWDAVDGKGAEVQIVNAAGGYNHYYFITDATNPDGDEVTGWCNDDGDLATTADLIGIGNCVWFRVPTEATDGDSVVLNIAGQVNNESKLGIESRSGLKWDMRSNPFPVALDSAKMDMKGFDTVDYWTAVDGNGTEIQVLNAEGGYNHFYWVSDATDPDGKEVTGWCNDDGDLMDGGVIAPPMQGFWLKTKGEGGDILISK